MHNKLATMNSIKWITSKDLGILADGSYFEKQLTATSANQTVSYHVISGHLPPGIELTTTGLLIGVPTVTNRTQEETNYQASFTVRAANNLAQVADRTFNLLISGVQAPTILTAVNHLGSYLDGEYFSYQLLAEDEYPGQLTWRYVRGKLPPGITLSKDGLLQGFFYQNKIVNDAFAKIGWDKLAWDQFMYDFVRQQNDTEYEFTVELSDGINYSRQNYIIEVIAKDLFTADRTIRTSDTTVITADRTVIHRPFITTMPQRLPEIKLELARQNTYFAFKFDAMDFDGDDIYYEITSPDNLGFDQDGDTETHSHGTGFDTEPYDSSEYPMPLYLGLNNETGWYTGHIARQVPARKDYTFQVYARKPYNKLLQGYRSTFVITILGQVDENVSWITNSDLGTIDNGAISALRIEAANSSGAALQYHIKGDGGRMPQGLRLGKTGMISGRVSFEYFSLDQRETTIDKYKTTSFDKAYTFTIVAETANKSAYSEKTFNLVVNHVNQRPYENLYLKGFPTVNQRLLFQSIMGREDLFPSPLIYRLDDPYYGKAKDLRFLFMTGIEPTSLPTYVEALGKNHYTKTILFGDVKTAVALDDNYNIQYEVVYLDVVDDQEGKDPVTGQPAPPAQTISLAGNQNFYTFPDGSLLTEITPNALGNMQNRVAEYIGLSNPSTLPQWMTCPQIDYDNPGKYKTPLGYIRAIVLAYTIPGASKLIAYRLKNAEFNFNNIPFRTDRYQLDNYLSVNYDLELAKFLPGSETTVDQRPARAERYREIGNVTYAVSGSYASINNQTISDIINEGGIDGVIDFAHGDTIIFLQPETFGDEKPGYFEHIMLARNNEKSYVYQINIDNLDVVTLSVAHQTQPGDIVQIIKGATYAGRKFNFEAYPLHGNSPRWWVFDKPLLLDANTSDKLVKIHHETSFDQHGTRFISYRDQYADIDSTAKYIKFPYNGVFT